MSEAGQRLASRFAAVGVQRAGILLLRPGDAVRLVHEAQAAGVEVYGLDAFLLHPDDGSSR